MTLTQWNPYNDLVSIRDTLDRLVDDRYSQAFSDLPGQRSFNLPVPVDMYEVNGEVIVKTNLPGIKADEIEITVKGDSISITGEFKSEDDDVRDNVHILERCSGKFQREITLPEEIDTEQSEAVFEDGVLTISMPKLEQSVREQIPVRS